MLVFTADKVLAESTAEQWLDALAAKAPQPATFDLSECRRITGGAAWRIGNAMRRLSQCSVVIPDSSSSGRNWEFLNLTRSGFGYSIARYANAVVTRSETDETERVRKYYSELSEQSGGNNAVGVYGLDYIVGLIPNEDHFNTTIQQWLDQVSPAEPHDPVNAESFGLLCWEAVTNLVDHSMKAPLPPRTKTLGSVSARWYSLSEVDRASGRQSRWLFTVRRMHRAERSLLGFIDVVINDDGVGVAARQSSNPDIYWSAAAEESAAVLSALADGSSIKPIAKDAPVRGRPGSGFTNIADSLGKLHAWASLRTGRLQVHFDGSTPGGTFELDRSTAPYMPGTCLEVRIPVWSSQLLLPLSTVRD